MLYCIQKQELVLPIFSNNSGNYSFSIILQQASVRYDDDDTKTRQHTTKYFER